MSLFFSLVFIYANINNLTNQKQNMKIRSILGILLIFVTSILTSFTTIDPPKEPLACTGGGTWGLGLMTNSGTNLQTSAYGAPLTFAISEQTGTATGAGTATIQVMNYTQGTCVSIYNNGTLVTTANPLCGENSGISFTIPVNDCSTMNTFVLKGLNTSNTLPSILCVRFTVITGPNSVIAQYSEIYIMLI